jgi:NDP-sugar pyrophosphorylase family protein
MQKQPIQHALIMAAGRGNRMRPLTDVLPKPMLNYKGDTLIGNSLQMLRNAITHIHVTVGYKKALLSEYLMTRGGVETVINTEGHGNAWWIQNTLMKYIDEPVLVLTTDNITELNFDFLSDEYQRLECPPCMLVPVLPIQGIDGDYIEQENGLVRSLQRTDPQASYCSGIQVLNPKQVLCFVESNIENFDEVWSILILRKLLKTANIYPQAWFSVDTLEQLAKINQ